MDRTIIISTIHLTRILRYAIYYSLRYTIYYSLRKLLVRGKYIWSTSEYLYIIFEFDTRILLLNITATYEACDISLPADLKSNCIELEY